MDAKKYFRVMDVGFVVMLVGLALVVCRLNGFVMLGWVAPLAVTGVGILVFLSALFAGTVTAEREVRRCLAPEDPELAPWADSEPPKKLNRATDEGKPTDAELIVRQISDEM